MSAVSVRSGPVSSVRASFFGLAAVLVAAIGYGGALSELVIRWTRQEEYSHGFLIPVVAAWLLWSRREAILASMGRPSWTGLALVALAAAMHVVGELSAIFILSQIGFIVVLIGIALAVGGYSLLRVTFIPIIFLAFAIPLPYFIDANLTIQLQLISSVLGVEFIKLFQIPVYLEGNIIDLGYYKLAVVEACSGLRYLYPLLSLSFLAAYLFQAPVWQRVVVFLSSIPITIVMNGFRIGMVGVLVDRWGTQMADGALHFFEGWIIFIACAGILTLEMWILGRISGKRLFSVFHLPKVVGAFAGPGSAAFGFAPLMTCLLVLCALGLTVHSISARAEIVPERTRFAAFPARIGQWQGFASLMDPATERVLKLDDYILSDYAKPGGQAVNLYVAYYASQRKGVSPHSPLVCIPGDGWRITHFERTTSGTGMNVPVNRMIIERDSSKQLVYYWFEERGRMIANEYWAKWFLLTDAITKNRTDGALVRLTTQVSRTETMQEAEERLRSFMRELMPKLAAYLPTDVPQAVRSVQYMPGHNRRE